MVKIKNNQSGMSAIVFAMVFAVVLTLLGVGFAFLVRQDQRETLDKTLSNQAQYAAETAINRKAYELKQLGSNVSKKTDCNENLDIKNTDYSAEAKVTCIQYSNEVYSLTKDTLSNDPYVTRVYSGNAPYNTIQIIWQSEDTNNGLGTTLYSLAGEELPTVDNANLPILRLALAYNLSNGSTYANTDKPVIMYLVPHTGGVSSIDVNGNGMNGKVIKVACNGGICTANLLLKSDANADFFTIESWLSMVAYGRSAKINSIKAISGGVSGTVQPIVGAQAIIDVNARAQDVTKRIQTRVPLISQTWNPGYATSAGVVCKDFTVDGSTNNSPASPGGNVCP